MRKSIVRREQILTGASRSRQIKPTALALAVAACFSGAALANPTSPTVVHGTATFQQAGNILNVTNSANAIINWGSFSISVGELTRFIQPSALSAVLNRVTGQDPSVILGALQSNGRVFLINPNGIVFGAGAQVDVAGLVASTLKLSNEDFLNNRMRFTDGAGAGSVLNQGQITGGSVYLVGNAVTNNGLITSPNGEVVLAAGNSVELVNPGTPNLRVEVVAAENEARNLGTISAEAGRIGIYAGLIHNSGTLNASSAVVEGGRILLKAAKNIETAATSTISASGSTGGTVTLQSGDTTLVEGQIAVTGSNGTGGSVQVLGDRVGLIGNASIDASGATDGGTVLVGGDFQGKNPEVQNAQRTYVGPEVAIKANSITNGDGGKVIVWADDTTRFYGHIAAQGGAIGGNGGFAEVSGKSYLDYQGLVNLSAPQGESGNLLLDPGNIVITDGPSDSIATYGGFVGSIFAAGDSTSTLTWNTILANLAIGNVAITTATLPPGFSVLSGDIDVQQGKTFSSSNSLGLFAHRNIQVGSGAHIVNNGTGDIYMFAGWDEASGATSSAAVNSGGGNLTVNANVITHGSMLLKAGNDIIVNGASLSAGGASGQYSSLRLEAYGGSIALTNSTVSALGVDGGEGVINFYASNTGGTINTASSVVMVSGLGSYANFYANGNVTLGQVSAESYVNVTSNNGAIIDGNTGLNVSAPSMYFSGMGGVGTIDNPLETQGALLDVYSSGGGIGVINAGSLSLNRAYAGGAAAAIGATGNLTVIDGGEGAYSPGGDLTLAANGDLFVARSATATGTLLLNAGGNVEIGGTRSNYGVSAYGGSATTVVAGGGLSVLPGQYGGYSVLGELFSPTAITTSGNVLVDQSRILGSPDVDIKVGGVININGTLAYGGKIEASSPSTININFTSMTGGFSVNGVAGLVYDAATNTGFFVNGGPASIGNGINIIYTGTPPTSSLTIPTETLIVAMGESTKPPDPEKDKDVFEDVKDEKKKDAPVCR